jgi:hypothetical protein
MSMLHIAYISRRLHAPPEITFEERQSSCKTSSARDTVQRLYIVCGQRHAQLVPRSEPWQAEIVKGYSYRNRADKSNVQRFITASKSRRIKTIQLPRHQLHVMLHFPAFTIEDFK